MPDSLTPLLPHIPAMVMVLFRISGIFIFAPVFGSQAIPPQIKIFLALSLTICVYPLLPPQPVMEYSMITLVLAVFSEMIIGLAIGYGATLPLIAVQMGGQIMGQQMGMALANVLNPDTGAQSSIVSQMFFLMALTIFVLLNGHHALLATLIHSFDHNHIPIGMYRPDGSVVALLLGLLASMFELGMRVSAPLLTLVFLQTIAMGFVAKTVPQLNILSLGFPLRILMGILIVSAMAVSIGDVFIEEWEQTRIAIMNMFAPSIAR